MKTFRLLFLFSAFFLSTAGLRAQPLRRFLSVDPRKGAELLMDLGRVQRRTRQVDHERLVIQDLRQLGEDNPEQAVFAIDSVTMERFQASSDVPVNNLAGPNDPLEVMNRVIWYFNSTFYQVVLTPLKEVYVFVVPTFIRSGITRFAYNAAAPIRITNLLLQGKPKKAGMEFLRFLINTTIGIGGIFDPATKLFKMKTYGADFGQTLGRWGMGPIFYLVLPFMGPSNLRDGIGTGVDAALNPLTYGPMPVNLVVRLNEMVYSLEQFETLKAQSYDTYVLAKKLYHLIRNAKIYF